MNKSTSLKTPKEVRTAMASGELTSPTSGLCPGYAQANLVILNRDWAFDFLLFALRNPKPCPLMEVLDPGDPFTKVIADRADVRKELPRYRVWEKGELKDEPTDISGLWTDDLVSFFLGCSFSFEHALMRAGLPVRHMELSRNVPMFNTNRQARSAGRFHGPLVVSMRPIPGDQVDRAIEVSAQFGGAHGDPVHVGDPAELGIRDLQNPEYGDGVPVNPGEVPVFWACGVTPQAAILETAPPLAITHAPGHMFISDLKSEEQAPAGCNI